MSGQKKGTAKTPKNSKSQKQADPFTDMQQNPKRASTGIIPYYVPQRRITLEEWQTAIDHAENPYTLNRFLYYRASKNAMLDLHLSSITETRLLDLQSAKFKWIDPSGKEDPGALAMFQAQWYLDYLQFAYEQMLEGFSLMEMFDLAESSIEVTLNRGKVAFKPLACVDLIPRDHVRPETGKWLVNTFDPIPSGQDFTQPPINTYYMGVGKKKNLGLMKKVIPVALAKRYAMAHWQDYDEKLGIPFRKVTMQGSDPKREKRLAEIMANMGPAGWGIFHEGELVELLQNTGSDPYKCFLELITLCDDQMSKAILGSTMVVDAKGGNYKGEVHERTSEIRHEADKTFIEYLNNEQLIWRLVKRGYPLEGYRCERDNKQELSLDDQIKIDTILLQYYDIEPEYIAGKYDIPEGMIKGKSPQNIQDVVTEETKKKGQPANKKLFNGFSTSIINACEKIYFSCGKPVLNASKSLGYDDIQRVINDIFSGKLKAGDLDPGLFNWQVNQILTSLQEGYGTEFVSFQYNKEDSNMINKIKENAYVFSAAKNYQELKAMSEQLLDENGKVKPRRQFLKDAQSVTDTYDVRFLDAERGHALVSSKAISDWETIWKERGTISMLTYNAILDSHTTTLCRDLDGIQKPVEDPFWDIYYVPNHWGERASVDQSNDKQATDTSGMTLPDPKPMFRGNVGKTGIVFPDNHPYFQMSKAQMKKNNDFAQEKFNPDGE